MAARGLIPHERSLVEVSPDARVQEGVRTVLVQLAAARPVPERLIPPRLTASEDGGAALAWGGAEDGGAARITVRRVGLRLEVWVWAAGRTLLEAALPTVRLPPETVLLLSTVTHAVRPDP